MTKRPNIVFFFTDQQRWDTLGIYGQKLKVSPVADSLAKQGGFFENAFSCQPVCGPARSCMQTGKYATSTGCFTNDRPLPETEKTIAHYLSESGYKVGYIGKWHLASSREKPYYTSPVPPEKRGGYKDYWIASDALEMTSHGYDGYLFDDKMEKVRFKGYRADKVTDFALDYIENVSDEEPFFLFLSHIEPHHQNDTNRYEGPSGSKEKFKNFDVPGDLKGTQGDWRENYPDYLGCCNSLDKNLGRIIDKLKEKGLYEDTLIIFTSDHGSHFKTRNYEYKRSCHDSSIRIPLVISGPGFKNTGKIRNMTGIIDLPPTILRAAGVDIPSYMHGRPLQDIVNGNTENWPDEVFFQVSESETGRGIRSRKWKYYVVAPDADPVLDSGSNIYVEKELYDLENDPHEKNNLFENSDYRETASILKTKLLYHMEKAGETIPEIKEYQGR